MQVRKFKSLSRGIGFLAMLAMLVCMTNTAVVAEAKEKVIKIKYGSYAPRNIIDEPALWYFEEVAKRSHVKIEVETYFGGTLAKPPDCLDAIGNGVYDAGWISPVFTPGKTPLMLIPNATPLVAQSLYSGVKAADELANTFSPAGEEFDKAKVKLLFHSGAWHYQLISNKPVASYGDIKGLRVRTFGYISKAWAALGGSPVAMPIPEIYNSLQKGIIDAVLTQPISMFNSLRLCEVSKHYTKVDFGCLPVPVIMNLKTWNSLPESVKKAMMDLASEMPAITDQMITSREMKAIEEMKKDGISFAELPEADKEQNKKIAKTIAEVVVEDLSSKGVTNARKAMDTYLYAIEKYSK